jgi:Uma2 family endonuclease
VPYSSAMVSTAVESSGPYTWDDFVDLDDEDKRELIDGELVETEVPNVKHERLVMRLGYFLMGWVRVHGGDVLGSGYKIRITAKRGVMPDVQLFRKDNPVGKDQEKGLVRGRPDLAIEIISPSSHRYDRVTKLAWYASIAVPEYWLVDPEAKTLERLVLDAGRYTIADALGEADVLRPESFEGLEIPLGELWV